MKKNIRHNENSYSLEKIVNEKFKKYIPREPDQELFDELKDAIGNYTLKWTNNYILIDYDEESNNNFENVTFDIKINEFYSSNNTWLLDNIYGWIENILDWIKEIWWNI